MPARRLSKATPEIRVPLAPLGLEEGSIQFNLRKAIEAFWSTLEQQSSLTHAGDRGNRAGATGGKQMDGVAALLARTALTAGASPGSVHIRSRLELPGFFRPEKKWDFLVVEDGCLVAAAELKSQIGPSFGNNFNNRSEEAIGSGLDLVDAFEKRPTPNGTTPWRGWMMLLEDSPRSRTPVRLKEPHFKADSEFRRTSYAARYAELCRRLVSTRLYTASALILAPRSPRGEFHEPDPALGMLPFLNSLAKACRR